MLYFNHFIFSNTTNITNFNYFESHKHFRHFLVFCGHIHRRYLCFLHHFSVWLCFECFLNEVFSVRQCFFYLHLFFYNCSVLSSLSKHRNRLKEKRDLPALKHELWLKLRKCLKIGIAWKLSQTIRKWFSRSRRVMTKLKKSMLSPFCGQRSFTGNFSYSRMTPMVQLSWSLLLVSSSVCLSKSALSAHSCSFRAVNLMFSLCCPEMTVLTAVGEESHYCSTRSCL